MDMNVYFHSDFYGHSKVPYAHFKQTKLPEALDLVM